MSFMVALCSRAGTALGQEVTSSVYISTDGLLAVRRDIDELDPHAVRRLLPHDPPLQLSRFRVIGKHELCFDFGPNFQAAGGVNQDTGFADIQAGRLEVLSGGDTIDQSTKRQTGMTPLLP